MKPILTLLTLSTLTLSACPGDTLVIDIYGISDAHLIHAYHVRDTVEWVRLAGSKWHIRKCGQVQLPILATAYQVMITDKDGDK